MSLAKTQIYLEPEQQKVLRKVAKQEHTSVSGLIRQLVEQYIGLVEINGDSVPQKKLSIIGIGNSEFTDVSENHDKYVGEAIAKEHNIRRH